MRLVFQEIGAGSRPVVLLHGFLGAGRNLLGLARRWASADATRRFLLPDLTGHGGSPPLPEGTDLYAMGRHVVETLRAAGVTDPLSIVGHSLGGRVALAARIAVPGAVGPVTLLDIGPSAMSEGADEGGRTSRALLTLPELVSDRETAREALLAQGLDRGIVEWLLTNLVPRGDAYGWRIDRAALAAFRPRLTGVELWPAITRDGTTRVVRGARSGYVPVEELARLQQAGVVVESLVNSGHFVHVDQPAALVDALLRLHPD